MSVRVVGVVLTYHPPKETVENVKAILQQVDHVFLVNNKFEEMNAEIAEELERLDRITMVNNVENLGVAAGFNLGMKLAFQTKSCKYVILFDQDSYPDAGMSKKLLRVAEGHSGVGVVGPALRDRKSKIVFKGSIGHGVIPRDILISSGSLISRELVEKIGYYQECLFIDYVDHEYCLRVLEAGRQNLQVLDALMDHQFGETEVKKILGRNVFPSNYSPMRHYYMARNRMIVLKKYGWGAWFWSDISYVIKGYLKTILYEKTKWRKTVAIARGTWDGLWWCQSYKSKS